MVDGISPTLGDNKHKSLTSGSGQYSTYYGDGQHYLSDMDMGIDPDEALLGDYLDPSVDQHGSQYHQQRTGGFSNINLSGFNNNNNNAAAYPPDEEDKTARKKGANGVKLPPTRGKKMNKADGSGLTPAFGHVNINHHNANNNASDLSPSMLPLLNSPYPARFSHTPNSKSNFF